jgi:hypothetical protein
MLPLEAPEQVNREIVTFIESLGAPPSVPAADARKRPFARVLDRLSRMVRRRRVSPPN